MGYYPSGCDILPAHVAVNCNSNENGRVRGVAFIHKDVTFIDPTDATEWTTYIAQKKIHIIPETNGSFDGGSPGEGPGYGDSVSTYTATAFSLKFKDPNLVSNRPFYNAIMKSRNYKIGWLTETQLWLGNKPCVVMPKPAVEDNLQSATVWDVEAKWTEENLPTFSNIPDGIFVV